MLYEKPERVSEFFSFKLYNLYSAVIFIVYVWNAQPNEQHKEK